MNVDHARSKLHKVLDSLPAGSVAPDDVVVMKRIVPNFVGKAGKQGYKEVPCVCIWGPDQDRTENKPRIYYQPKLSQQAGQKQFNAALLQAETRAKWVRDEIAQYNDKRRT